MTYKAFHRAVYSGIGYPITAREQSHELRNGYPNALIIMSGEQEAREEAHRLQEEDYNAMNRAGTLYPIQEKN